MLSYIHVNRRLLDRKKDEIRIWYEMGGSELALLGIQMIADTEDRLSCLQVGSISATAFFFLFFSFALYLYFRCSSFSFFCLFFLLASLVLIYSLPVSILNHLFIYTSFVKIHVCNYTYSPLTQAAIANPCEHVKACKTRTTTSYVPALSKDPKALSRNKGAFNKNTLEIRFSNHYRYL